MKTSESEHKNIPLGFVKDAIAFPMFFAGIVIILLTKDLNVLRESMIVLLLIAMMIDGSFTLQPSLHCSPFGLNEATFFTMAIFMIGFIFVVTAFLYHCFVSE